MRNRTPRLFTGSIGLGLMVAGTIARPGQARLALLEVDSWTLPDSFALSGMSTSAERDLVLWSSSSDHLILLNHQLELVREVPLPGGIEPRFVSVLRDHSIEFVEWDSAKIHRLTYSAGRYLHQAEMSGVEGSVVAAARGEDRWVFLSRGRDSVLTLYRSRFPGGEEWASTTWRDGGTGGYMIGVNSQEILITQREAPFHVRVVGMDLRERADFQPDLYPHLLQGPAPETTVVTPRWMSLPALPLDRGWVQTLADLTSDRRVIVLYDEAGQHVRSVHLDVPLGLAISLPEERVLFASRRTNALEIVRYEWRWVPDHHLADEPGLMEVRTRLNTWGRGDEPH